MSIIIENTALSQDNHSIKATICLGEKTFELFFNSQGAALTNRPEAFIASALLSAMKFGAGSIQVNQQPSPLFLENLDKIQAIFHSWKPAYQLVKIESAQPYQPVTNSGDRVGLFFSAGVDTFYSLLSEQDEITDLIFIHGFDIPLDAADLLEKRSQTVQRIAASAAKGVVEIKTNLKEFMSSGVFWGFSHGPALACIGHLLAGEFKRLYIASGYDLHANYPWGTYPDLDPLWRNEQLEFIHHGAEITRPQKVFSIARNQTVLDNLHVCLRNLPSGMNCGQCEKCVRTMISLRAIGALERCPTFEQPLTDSRIYHTYMLRSNQRLYVKYNLELAKQTGADPQLIKILRRIDRSPALPGWRKILSKLGYKLPVKINPRL